MSYGKYEINELNLTGCADKALSLGENSDLSISEINIDHSKNGIVSKDSSFLEIKRGNISDVDTCMLAYRKKIEFSGAKILYNDTVCNNYNKLHFKSNNSIISKNE